VNEIVYRIGADENGLGARLGPLVVTAVLARVGVGAGERVVSRKPPKRLRRDLGDSKALVSHGDVTLGEAWTRAVLGPDLESPSALFEKLSLEGTPRLRAVCPKHAESQCWSTGSEAFLAEPAMVERVRGHLAWFAERGVEIVAVKSSVVCAKGLNDGKVAGRNRFVSDLHAMERLVLELREVAGRDVTAVCGKVGGMEDYSRFFGPLSFRLHAVLAKSRAKSAYHFPGVGELRFLRDADGKDCLVMLASIIGKYVRELLMARVASYYLAGQEEPQSVSGYHDPVTARFVAATELVRRSKGIPDRCFERLRDEA
jgi:ribonuclease HII